MSSHFPILIITGRPAAGKSEVIDFLKKCDPIIRLEKFHIANFEELDDFVYVWETFELDDLMTRFKQPRIWSDEKYWFICVHGGALLQEGPRSVEGAAGEDVGALHVPSRWRPCPRSPPGSGCPAYDAPLIAPTEAPKTRSARMPRRISSSSMPTCTAPRLPPPASTKAVLCGAGQRTPSAPCRRCAHLRRRRSDQVAVAAPIGGGRCAHGAARGGGGDCWPRDCWRSRHAFRPARSWRTAHTMTRTASTTMATTKIPKITKENPTFVRRRRQRDEGSCHAVARVCHTPWAHCTDGSRRTTPAAQVRTSRRRAGGSWQRERGARVATG